MSTVTASLSGVATEPVTVTVLATPVSPALDGDFTLSTNTTLTIAQGATISTGTVTITAVNNQVKAADKTVTVSGVVRGGGVATPSDQTLTITDDDGAPTVSLAAAPNPVTEGSPVTVTARLSRVLQSPVTIPLTVTRTSSEAGDHGTLASIAINAGSLTGTDEITTAQDSDTDNEMFTVALGNLPNTVTAGTPASVRVTINETGPGAPGNLSATATTDGSGIVVTWRAPANTGSTAVAEYIVYAGRSVPPPDSVGTSTSTTFTLTPVAPSTTYYFRVRAVNVDGHRSPFSALASFTTAGGGTDATKVRGLSGLAGRRQIALSWQAPTGTSGLRRYRVQVASASGGPFTDLADTETTLYVHAGLPDGATRWYRVAAVYSGNNRGTWSDVASVSTNGPPSAPRDLTATKGITRVKLRWQAPASTGGSPLTGYRIERSMDGGSAWTTVASVEPNATQYTHEEAVPPPGQTVEYRVIAINALGESPPSDVAEVTSPARRPSAPRDVSASASGRTVTVVWTAPAEDGGAPVTGYQVEVSTGSCRAWRAVSSTVAPATLSYTHAELEPATRYCYRVLARNRGGD